MGHRAQGPFERLALLPHTRLECIHGFLKGPGQSGIRRSQFPDLSVKLLHHLKVLALEGIQGHTMITGKLFVNCHTFGVRVGFLVIGASIVDNALKVRSITRKAQRRNIRTMTGRGAGQRIIPQKIQESGWSIIPAQII